MNFGDKLPYENVTVVSAVGNSPNAAVAAARLGLSSALVSNQGDDEIGKKQRDILDQEHVNSGFVRDHAGMKSNYHYVLWYKSDRTILVKHEDYPYSLPDIGDPKWLYLTSLGPKSLEFHQILESYIVNHKSIKLAFQPGTFQIKLGKERLKRLYERSEIFFCNIEEAQTILETKEEDPKKLMQALHELGPKIVCITDGPNGAYASTALGTGAQEAWFIPPYPEALAWAPINSMSVVQYVGAREGLLTRAQLEEHLASAPASYVPKSI